MNLRSRALFILGLTFLAFLAILSIVMYSVTIDGMDRIENEDLSDTLSQTDSGIRAESVSLLSTAQDWATWDEMYEYAVVHNTGFIDRNANPDNMATISVHLFMVLDTNGTLVYGRLVSTDFTTNTSVPEPILQAIQNNPRLSQPAAVSDGTAGLLDLPDGPMILAATPILRSDNSGPSHGTLIMGRYFAYGPLQRISGITGYPLSVSAVEDVTPDTEYLYLPTLPDQHVSGQEGMTIVRNQTSISGYRVQKDLAGQDFILGVTMDRTLSGIGNANLATDILVFAIWGIVTVLVVLVVIDRIVLRRMEVLADHVRSLSGSPEGVPTPVLSGNDELAALERTILSSRADLQIREEQLRVFVNAMPGPAALFSRDGKILLTNPAFADIWRKRVLEATGSDQMVTIPPEIIGKYDRYVAEALEKKEAVRFETDWHGRTFLVSYYPVLGTDGEVIQLGLLAFDISERKRLENALRKVTRKIALLNTVIFSDIQNKVFVQTGYIEISRQMASDPKLKGYLDKEADVVKEIQDSLRFAQQYNDMGASPPRWQNVQDVMLFAISHLDLGTLSRDFQLGGIEVFSDPLMERVFVTLVENTILHAKGATRIRAGYSVNGDDAVIFVEDDGPGIPADRKELIFEKGIGTGGSGNLFLSREILSITGMTMTENGVPGKGARFEIRVPKDSYRFSGR